MEPTESAAMAECSLSAVRLTTGLESAFAEHAQANGERVPAGSVLAVLRAAGVEATEQQLQEVVPVLLGCTWRQLQDSEGLTIDEVAELVAGLTPRQGTTAETTPSATWLALSALLRRILCCRRTGDAKRKTQEFGGKMKPTTRLLLVIIVIALIIALSVVGLAIGLSWVADMQSKNDALQKELDLVMSAVQSFSVTQAQAQEAESSKSTTTMLVNIIHEVGYKTNLQTITSSMLNDAQVAALLVDHHHDLATKDEMKLMASNLGAVVDELFQMGYPSIALRLVNRLNKNRLPEGHEIVVAGPNISNGGNTTVLTELKYQSACPDASCTVSLGSSSPMGMALSGKSGSFVGTDYTNRSVYGGYAALPNSSLALVYKINVLVLREKFLNQTVAAINALNAEFQGTTEIMVQQKERPGRPLTVLKMPEQCSGSCGVDLAGAAALTRLYSGQTGTAIDKDYRGTVPIISAAAILGSMNGSLLFEIDVSEVKRNIMGPLSSSSSDINDALPGTTELLLGQSAVVNSTVTYQYLTDRRYGCLSGSCRYDSAMYNASVRCQQGSGVFTDYRGVETLVSFACVPDLDVGLLLKQDMAELHEDSLQQTVAYANSFNLQQTGSLELVVGRKVALNSSANVTATTVKILTDLRQCGENCGGGFSGFGALWAAVSGGSGLQSGSDYRGVKVLSAYGHIAALSAGVVFKVDRSEVEGPMILRVIILVLSALALVIAGCLLLHVAARRLLSSIEETWERSKQAVQEQKQSFENLVSALYPRFASERLLAGDTQIHLELPEVTMFFSDICNFSMISNRLTAEEMLGWIGYVFFVMDHVADHYYVHKIKTIGDAYFAISGLPGLGPSSEG
eukprot:RCo001628